MVREHWHFTAPPFDGSLEPASFYAGIPQEEALARLEWLVDERQRVGLVVAAEGCGKSHLCSMAARRLAGLGAEVALLSLGGLAEGDWLEMLLERLPLDRVSRTEPLRPWQKLENRLRENRLMERATAFLFDDLDRAPPDAVEGVVRLASGVESLYARTVVIATASPEGWTRLPAALRQRAAVRIELPAWDEGMVAGFLDRAIVRVGGAAGLFSAEAAATLARFSAGVPRLVGQLAQWSLAAAAGDGLSYVDAGTVERAWRELAPQWEDRSDGHSPAGQQDDSPGPGAQPEAGQPQVRVVRRLWG